MRLAQCSSRQVFRKMLCGWLGCAIQFLKIRPLKSSICYNEDAKCSGWHFYNTMKRSELIAALMLLPEAEVWMFPSDAEQPLEKVARVKIEPNTGYIDLLGDPLEVPTK